MATESIVLPGGAAIQRNKKRGGKPGRHLLAHTLIILVGLLMIYPLLWLIVSAFRPQDQIFSEPGLVPREMTLQNFVDGWNAVGPPFAVFLANSTLVAGLAVIGNLFSCTLAAYAFARLEFRFKPLLFAVMLGTIMLPLHVVLVPQYIMFQSIDWTNTFLPLVVPKFLAVDAFFIFLMVQFIRGLPRELDDAATVDGCGPIAVFWRVILPLMRPALAVTAVFTFIWTWNDFLTPLLYITDRSLFTTPVALNAFQDSTGATAWGPMFAMSLVSLIPLFVIFLIAQKHLIRGIATTGLK
ncbi:carbohydrate ABC transporter permease [Paenarthrobacter ureafaciens]|uniref:carbohydrate ABC transporter permease n=1 Tax=Paenarthrobacter ureafaciens TaxID=37931 RepID=UPI002DB7B2E8|nr:carbohydrate ABC transporter permease [Paenarthrobacter ureafaciens]MEC3853147.1 carbohydrate ABC transporter permease [Paenarthrobacter ureafaciens]